jgi:hypothetical protein
VNLLCLPCNLIENILFIFAGVIGIICSHSATVTPINFPVCVVVYEYKVHSLVLSISQ